MVEHGYKHLQVYQEHDFVDPVGQHKKWKECGAQWQEEIRKIEELEPSHSTGHIFSKMECKYMQIRYNNLILLNYFVW